MVRGGEEVGLAHLSVRAVADHLGVSTSALYRHVDGLDDLVVAVGERVVSAIEAPPDVDQPWEDFLVDLGLVLHRAAMDHPGLGRYWARATPESAQLLDLSARCAQVVSSRGVEPADALVAVGTVAVFAVSTAERWLQDAPERSVRAFAGSIAGSERATPMLRAARESYAGLDPERYLTWTLEALVAGMALQLGRGRSPTGPDPGQGGRG